MAGVAQQVVEYAGHLVGVAAVFQPGRQVGTAGQALLGQHGAKLADHLLHHAGKVGGPAVQFNVGKIEPRDVEKFVDEILQPFGFVQRDAGVPRPHLWRDLRLIPQKRQIADHTGQRRFQVVRQVDDQVVFALLGLTGDGGVALHLLAGQPQFGLGGGQHVGQVGRGGVRVHQAAGGLHDPRQVPLIQPEKRPSHPQPAAGQQQNDEQYRHIPHRVHQIVQRYDDIRGKKVVVIISYMVPQGRVYAVPQHKDDKGGERYPCQGQQIQPHHAGGAAAVQRPAAAVSAAGQPPQKGFRLIQWCSPPPKQS